MLIGDRKHLSRNIAQVPLCGNALCVVNELVVQASAFPDLLLIGGFLVNHCEPHKAIRLFGCGNLDVLIQKSVVRFCENAAVNQVLNQRTFSKILIDGLYQQIGLLRIYPIRQLRDVLLKKLRCIFLGALYIAAVITCDINQLVTQRMRRDSVAPRRRVRGDGNNRNAVIFFNLPRICKGRVAEQKYVYLCFLGRVVNRQQRHTVDLLADDIRLPIIQLTEFTHPTQFASPPQTIRLSV